MLSKDLIIPLLPSTIRPERNQAMNKVDSKNGLSESVMTQHTAPMDDMSFSFSKVVQFQMDPAIPEKVMVTKHRYRKPKNPSDLYVGSEEQRQYGLECRALAKELRQQLDALEDLAHSKTLLSGFLAPGRCRWETEQAVEALLPLHYALDEQLRGLEKEVCLHFKQQCTQHRKRHAQKVALSQDGFYRNEEDKIQKLASLSTQSSSKASSLARMVALADERYVVELNKAEPICLPPPPEPKVVEETVSDPVEPETPTKAENENTKSEEEKKVDNPSSPPRKRSPLRNLAKFGRKSPKERKAPGAARSFTRSIRRIGHSLRRSGSFKLSSSAPEQPRVPMLQV